MPRSARLVLPGYFYHVTQRGNHRKNVFASDQDRVIYLKYLQEYSLKYTLKIYAYCLMDNHVHFIVKPEREESLARVFQITHQRYAYYFQRKVDQKGHFWQGRFYSCLLDGSHLQAAVRYVERNPVRAEMVKKAWDYPWSSARAHLGQTCRIILLSDIREYIDDFNWKEYLTEEENEKFVRVLRLNTRKGRLMAPREKLQELETELKVKLLPKRRGRPRGIKK